MSRVLLYGQSLILTTIGTSLQKYPSFDLVAITPPVANISDLRALAPNALIFDVEAAYPEAAFDLLASSPELLLIGVSPTHNRLVLWSGQHFVAGSMQELVQLLNGDAPARPAS